MAARLLTMLAGLVLALPAGAIEPVTQPIAELKWVARPIVIFADSPADPRLALQLSRFGAEEDELINRDVVVLVDTEPGTLSELRARFRPRDFEILVLGKDGEVKYRKPSPITVREIIRLIDRMPLRRQEIETRRSTPTN